MTIDQWTSLPGKVCDLIVARILESQPESAHTLLSTCKTLRDSTCRSLYQELYVIDNEEAFDTPTKGTRLATVFANVKSYAKFVRIITIVPQPILHNSLTPSIDSSEDDTKKDDFLTPRQLGKILATFSNLEAIIWASDRVPPPQFCELVSILCPHVDALYVRPAFSTANLGPEHRWSAEGISKLSSLKTLAISHVSAEGIRRITNLLPTAEKLATLTIDSQFADDQLLRAMGEMKVLSSLVLRCSGTKVTDKGIISLLENSITLESLELNELEGRLSKNLWYNINMLPDTLQHFKMSYSEEGPHHSWVTDHLDGIFQILSLSQIPLKTFSITTILPECFYLQVPHSEASAQNLNPKTHQLRRSYQNACDDKIAARKLPEDALKKILLYGEELEVLELDMYEICTEDVRRLMDRCKQLRHLRILLNSPLSKMFGLSSSFVQMTKLEKLSVSLTEAHCPLPGIIQVQQEGKGKLHLRTNSEDVESTKSPKLTNASPIITHSPLTTCRNEREGASDDRVGIGRRPSIAQPPCVPKGLLIINAEGGIPGDKLGCKNDWISNTNVTDACIPPKREIRKLARRCPSLRTINWYGRLGKGEWSIIPAATTLQTGVIFTPIYLIEDRDRDKCTSLTSGADVERFIVSRRIANLSITGTIGLERADREEVNDDVDNKLALLPPALLDDIEFPRIETGMPRGAPSSPISLHTYSSRDTSTTLVSSPTLSNKSPKMPIRYAVGLPSSHAYSNMTSMWEKEEARKQPDQRSYAEATNKNKEITSPKREAFSTTRARSSSHVVSSWNLPPTFGKEGSPIQEARRASIITTNNMPEHTKDKSGSTAKRGSTLPKKPVFTPVRRASQPSGQT